jgi:hypothetical protein
MNEYEPDSTKSADGAADGAAEDDAKDVDNGAEVVDKDVAAPADGDAEVVATPDVVPATTPDATVVAANVATPDTNVATTNVVPTTNAPVAKGGYGKIGGDDEKAGEKAGEEDAEETPGATGETPAMPAMPPMSPEIKLPNVNLLGNIAEVAKTILESLDLLIAKMIDQNLTNQVNEANTTDAADAEEPRFIDDLHQKIITAAAYHLEKPEGRQMYLRQIDKLLTQSTNAITGMDSIIGPLFAQCLQSESIQTCIKTTIASIIGNPPDPTQNNKHVIRQEDLQQFVNLLTAEITNLYNEKNIMGGMYTLLECNKVDKDTLDKKKVKDNEHPLQGGKQNKSSSRKGNRKGSRNRKYLPKKNNHTRKKH